MGKFKKWRDTRSRFTAIFAVSALVAAITVPGIVGAIAANLQPTSDTITLSAPCAVFDTRFWDRDGDGTEDGLPRQNDHVEFYVAGETNAEGDWSHGFGDNPETTATVEDNQGGAPGGCNVPTTAESVYISITAVSPETGGNVRAWDNLGDIPTGGFLLYSANVNSAGATFVALNTTTAAEDPTDGSHSDNDEYTNDDEAGNEFGGHLIIRPSGTTHLKGTVFAYTE